MVTVLALSYQPACALMTFTGSLSTPDGIYATEPWMTEGVVLNWEVMENADGSWDYRYWFRDYAGGYLDKEISHMIVAISPDAYAEDFWGGNGPLAIQTYDPSDPSNPGLPSAFYGLKIDISADDYFFTSSRAPVWGDFYMKDGKEDQSDVYAYNSTFGSDDPLDPPSNGSINYKILRPDTYTTIIPEPGTLLLLGSALALAGGYRRFRK
jgi:hypothetical protein